MADDFTIEALSCPVLINRKVCGATEGLVWVRHGCAHEHVFVNAVCITCSSLLSQRPQRCVPCRDAEGTDPRTGTPYSHICELHIEGTSGELGTPSTHPLTRSTSRIP